MKKSGYLTVCMCVLLTAGIFAAEKKEDAKNTEMICAFEDESDLQAFDLRDVEAEIATEHATEGKTCAKLIFAQAQSPAFTSQSSKFTANFPTDWSAFDQLCIDFYNSSDAPANLKIKMKSNDHAKQAETVITIPVKKTFTAKIKLDKLKEKLDMADIMYLGMYLWTPPAAFTIYVDNIRLVKKEK